MSEQAISIPDQPTSHWIQSKTMIDHKHATINTLLPIIYAIDHCKCKTIMGLTYDKNKTAYMQYVIIH